MGLDLQPYSEAQIARIETVAEAAHVKRMADAAAEFYRAQDDWATAQKAKEVAMRSARRAGEILAETPRQHGGDRRSAAFSSFHGGMLFQDVLEDAGLSTTTAHRWQQLAKVPLDSFEAYFGEAEFSNWEYTFSSLLRWVRGQAPDAVTPALPDGLFPVIYADPPWRYDNSGLGGSAEKHYPTMPTEDICGLPVQEQVPDDAVLFLWATNPMLRDALAVMAAWGFAYKSNLVWIKDRATYGKLGFYVRGRHELLLLGTRGSMLPKGLPDSVIDARKQDHSRKPDAAYRIIEKMYGGPYLELFGRGAVRPGWTAWGNEAEG